MKRKSCKLIISIIFLMSLIGCATLGPKYTKIDKTPDKQALIYIYRPSNLIGAAISYDVKSEKTFITALPNGGYYPYFTNPGKIELWAKTESRSSVTLDVNPGQIYYVKGTLNMGMLVGRPNLSIETTENGEKEIVDCKLIPDDDKK